MSMFYAGRHRAPSTKTPQRTGASLVAVAAVGLGTAAATAPAASAAPATVSAPVRRLRLVGVVRDVDRELLRPRPSRRPRLRRQADPVAHRRQRRRRLRPHDGVRGQALPAPQRPRRRRHRRPRTGTKMGLTSSRTTTTTSRTTTRTVAGSSLLSTAASLVGVPYRYGGTTTSGFDCSGFTQYVFARHGKSLPRTAEAQRQAATRVSSPQAGDLVFFGAPAYHVAIYAGNGMIYDARQQPARRHQALAVDQRRLLRPLLSRTRAHDASTRRGGPDHASGPPLRHVAGGDDGSHCLVRQGLSHPALQFVTI